jgi:16S rRNA (cytosine1402-N4)-methyltransferase
VGNFHKSVLLKETIDNLRVIPGEKYVDCTLGDGGHTLEILKKGGKVLGIDVDPKALKVAELRIGKQKDFLGVKGNFANLLEIAKRNGFGKVAGVVFDLGVSLGQLEDIKRGFGFKSETLDMRMDPDLGIKAQDIINNFDERRLYEIFKEFGQEKFSRRIASNIVRARLAGPIMSGKELANIIERAVGRRGKTHPATRVFQALRITVNSELDNLEEALPQAVKILKPKGKLAVISFHSLEDRIVKVFLKGQKNMSIVNIKPIRPSYEELIKNPRSRSAKLRVAERIEV